MMSGNQTRRELARLWLAATAGVAGAEFSVGASIAQTAEPTPACGHDERATPAQTEGPYYSPKTPEKANFRADAAGDGFNLMGFVLDRRCRPIPRALVDLWHADSQGEYDNKSYRLRGHQFTDARGRFVFETITPGLYVGRTRHFHLKAQAPRGRILTTQLYFPDEPGNGRDGLFDRRLLMRVSNAADGKVGRFDIVLDV
ncbi:intradiol ring-cleavage dioxygenase [Terrarubrum flagellatum]|uniref:dioxygenase family protein n=1 Tax=Terrirubrum flagellatum TaxID=2895980 RepID=UPI00314551B4